MTNFSMEIQGANRVENKLRKLASELPHVTSRVIFEWAKGTRAILKSTPYPRKNTHKMRWVSEKQRRYVMAAIRRGDIQVPYRRTGALANRWIAAKTPDGAIIRNSARYSKLVIGDVKGRPMSQYWMHRSRWWLARTVINREAKKLPKLLAAEIRKEWKK